MVKLLFTLAVFFQLFMKLNQGWGAVEEISGYGQLGSNGETGSRLCCHGTVLPPGACCSDFENVN